MSNSQKGGHAQPLFTNVHAIDSFLAFPCMGIVEYVTLIKAISLDGIEMQLTEACIKIALSLIPYQFFQVHFISQCIFQCIEGRTCTAIIYKCSCNQFIYCISFHGKCRVCHMN